LLPGGCVGSVGLHVVVQESSQPKVQQLHPRFGQHRIGGLQISVDDAGPVRRDQSIRDLNSIFQRLVELQRSFLQQLGQRLTLDVLHHDEVDTVLLADVVQGADVRMIQLRYGFGFALEAGLALGAFGEVLGEDLDGYGAVEAGVVGFVDFTRYNGREVGS
jgi:hypothetical protein